MSGSASLVETSSAQECEAKAVRRRIEMLLRVNTPVDLGSQLLHPLWSFN